MPCREEALLSDMPAPARARPAPPVGDRDRFVAFAFAAAELLVELDADGRVTFAAGAFRTRLDRSPESLVGRGVEEIVAPSQRAALRMALSVLASRGRLTPLALQLADPARTPLAMAGLLLPGEGGQPRLCLTFAPMPAMPEQHSAAPDPRGFAQEADALLRAAPAAAPAPVLGLLQVNGAAGSASVIAPFLEASAPNLLVGELALGRYGVLPGPGQAPDLVALAAGLEAALRDRGLDASVAASALDLSHDGLSSSQAARALRHALNVFARGGAEALAEAGFDGGLTGAVAKTCARFQALRRAVRGRCFRLEFQPIVVLETGALHHYEALMRPDADVPPQEFVSDIEAAGLSEEFDLAVAEMTLEAALRADVPIAFNLSGLSMQSAGFRTRLLALLDASPPRREGLLLAEMTETAAVENLAEARQTAQALRDRGVKFCLDDFGAGTTALQTLRALPVDYVKLDGAYVRGVAQAGRDRAFIAAIVELAGAVGAATVAEQIETEAQAQALRGLGVQYGQGWLFGRSGPLPQPARQAARAGAEGVVKRRGAAKEQWG